MPFISILTNLYNAISVLTSGKDDQGARLTAVNAAASLSPDLSRLNDILNSQAAAHLVEEEVKEQEPHGLDEDGAIADSFESIKA